MVAQLLLASVLVAQVQVQTSAGRDSSNRREVSVRMQIGGPGGDTVRRIPVTAAHLASAFRDAAARTMLLGAREARLRQDSALMSYDAKVSQRISVGLTLRATARERLVMRDEGVARVQWDRDAGAVVDLLGKRTTVPLADDPLQIDEGVRTYSSLPIPYFPGRESLWIGGSVAQVSVNDENFVHPLADGAEAYYRYASGDSVVYSLPDDRRIRLRELRIEARAPRWNVIVGSFWFDQATAQLVRAVYRPSIEMDIWEVASESARNEADGGDDGPPGWLRGLVSPMKVSMQVFTAEYGLFEGRFWLPTSQSAEGKMQAMMMRIPAVFEERYEYASVNGPVDVARPMSALPAPPLTARRYRDSLVKAGLDSAAIDSLVRVRNGPPRDTAAVNARARARRDSIANATRARRDSIAGHGFRGAQIDSVLREIARQRQDSIRAANERKCLEAGFTTHRTRRYDGAVDVLLRVPCDLRALANSPELPPSAYATGEDLFDRRQRDELMDALDFGLQAGWGPQPINIDWGFGQSRYNRVEGFSTGIALRQELGRGYTWNAQLRASQGDRQLNGEIGILRSNARTSMRLNAYRRLVSSNDWGNPLSFSASIPALFTGRDDGVYYRAWGAELLRRAERNKQLELRLFAERASTADVTTRFSLFGGSHNRSFGANVRADSGFYAGAGVTWGDSWGLEPRGWRGTVAVRLEGAGGEREYGRSALDVSISRGLPGSLAIGLAGGAGVSVGELPAHRHWFLGGTATVRGQRARVDSIHAGNAFWYGRAELALDRSTARRIAVFGDLGWAGDRDSDWGRSQRLLAGVGVGTSYFDGMIRTDVARGLWPHKGWRFILSVEAPF